MVRLFVPLILFYFVLVLSEGPYQSIRGGRKNFMASLRPLRILVCQCIVG